MSRKLKFDIPGRDFRVYFDEFGPTPSIERWAELFGEDVPNLSDLVVDIGYGRGEFLIDVARRMPDRAFVGIERSFKRSLKMARRLPQLGLCNVRLLEAEAQDAITALFPLRSIASAWINFPDPWPKDRHARRRLVQPQFVRDLCERIVAGGSINLATDDAVYAQQMDEVLAGAAMLDNNYAPEPFRLESRERTPTAYEFEWKKLGRTCRYFAYVRNSCDAAACDRG